MSTTINDLNDNPIEILLRYNNLKQVVQATLPVISRHLVCDLVDAGVSMRQICSITGKSSFEIRDVMCGANPLSIEEVVTLITGISTEFSTKPSTK